MGLTKAKLKVTREARVETIEVLFNPSEYNLSDGANYAEKKIPGVDGPISQYVSGEATTLSLTLILDTTIKKKAGLLSSAIPSVPSENSFEDVSKYVKKLSDLTAIDGKQHRPPIVTFCWGSLNFKGLVTKVGQNYTMFAENGKPIRAKVTLEFKSIIKITESKKHSPFESPDRTKYRVLQPGMHLWSLAYEEYGDPELWRKIAQANEILNPLDIPIGQLIKIPAL
ncbi:MAG: hypothetical protein RR275_04840 [Lachnospiraceae bacterium]